MVCAVRHQRAHIAINAIESSDGCGPPGVGREGVPRSVVTQT
ncbi:hypothetical protein FM106_07825 [Brachybacterium faecium]|nr:hypothetical protein FM106_07825 [Brachybacterium faecium]